MLDHYDESINVRPTRRSDSSGPSDLVCSAASENGFQSHGVFEKGPVLGESEIDPLSQSSNSSNGDVNLEATSPLTIYRGLLLGMEGKKLGLHGSKGVRHIQLNGQHIDEVTKQRNAIALEAPEVHEYGAVGSRVDLIQMGHSIPETVLS